MCNVILTIQPFYCFDFIKDHLPPPSRTGLVHIVHQLFIGLVFIPCLALIGVGIDVIFGTVQFWRNSAPVNLDGQEHQVEQPMHFYAAAAHNFVIFMLFGSFHIFGPPCKILSLGRAAVFAFFPNIIFNYSDLLRLNICGLISTNYRP